MAWDLSRPETLCVTIQQHIERLKYLEDHQEELGVYYDEKAALRPEKFIERNLIHYEDTWAGKPFLLDEWQKVLILRPLFGWKLKETQTRLFRKAYIQCARGTGKSALNAAILLFMLCLEAKGQKLFCIGPNRETARQVFQDCIEFYRASKNLHKHLEMQGDTTAFITDIHTVAHPRSTLMPKTASKLNDGVRFCCTSCDELHRHPNGKLLRIYEKCASKSISSLLLIITNAGDSVGVCYDEYKYAKKVLNGEMKNLDYFAFIPEPDKDDDPLDIKTLEKVTPGFHSIIEDTRTVLQDLEDARQFEDKRTDYERFRLNSWVIGRDTSSFMEYKKWEEAGIPFELEDMYGSDVWLGLDLSKNTDFTSVSMLIEKNNKLYLHPFVFLPQSKIVKEVAYPFREWFNLGYLEEADAPDYRDCLNDEVILDKIHWINSKFQIKGIGIDPAMSSTIKKMLTDHSYTYYDVPQFVSILSDPTNMFRSYVYKKLLVHGNNPLLDWTITNCKSINVNGLIKLLKVYQQSSQRIDPVAGAIFALYVRTKEGLKDPDVDEGLMSLLNMPKGVSFPF